MIPFRFTLLLSFQVKVYDSRVNRKIKRKIDFGTRAVLPDAAAACGERRQTRKNFYLPRIEHRVSSIELIFRLTFL